MDVLPIRVGLPPLDKNSTGRKIKYSENFDKFTIKSVLESLSFETGNKRKHARISDFLLDFCKTYYSKFTRDDK